MNRTITAVSTCLCLTGFSLICQATELVYTPVNPNFGGNPLNGPTLLNEAQAQNDYKDPDLKRSTTTATSALERFSQQLQSSLLSQVLTNIRNGNTGSLTTDAFIVNVIDDSGSLSIQITDRVTGEISEVNVNGLTSN
ncbi:curli production assembly protein CsgF [Pseudomonas sp. Bc-h]|jgi:curli production assembly/transport component CsgF|uniref:curli assembly protein CsgF n=1 Tax=unclassified Pseudomonas TaxID=196821 RepID=UPI0009D98701|nr:MULTISPECIES: curli assembly protein CsgF [unclassified Pseudomonas]MDE1194352.1 curli assembly protein CsgF [Pseudomonas sp.]OQR28164.1 curli production assembly protein CsgF [Pseudomonas sp. Bc-h]